MMNKPFSQASENNKTPILGVLQRYMTTPGRVVEIGSGTGQHAVFMAQQLPHLLWQPTDVSAHLSGIEAWREASGLGNVLPARAFDVWDEIIPTDASRYLYSANTLHIMSRETVERFFSVIPQLLQIGGLAFFYGPFNYRGEFTSESNARFDQWLKQQAPHQGIRDFEVIERLARIAGLRLVEDCEMPSNNRTLVWEREH
jgi:cyclopropane fatty-acyl-phospholipid synthase-like methyltransferase